MTENQQPFPKLRLIDAVPVVYEGMRYLMLRDPYRLTEDSLFIPEPVIPLLSLMDGTRSPSELRGALAVRFGLFLSQPRLDSFLQSLDNALLLDNPRSREAFEEARAQFRALPFRPPASAGQVYPADAEELTANLQAYIDQLETPAAASPNGSIRGIVSPHIDYERGGPIYAQVWSTAAQAVADADLAVIFGTDHFSEGYRFSLTRQNYATPYGVLPTDTAVVDRLAAALEAADTSGSEHPQSAFAGELHHRYEHSIELAAVWLHFMRGGQPIPIVPILTGPLEPGGDSPSVRALLRSLRQSMRGRRALVIAAGDLAHVGPAFDTPPVDPGQLILLKDADDALMDAMCQGSAQQFLSAIESVQDANNVCGVSPIYLTLRLLAAQNGQSPLYGTPRGYAVCPADPNQTSVVTVCGVTLHG